MHNCQNILETKDLKEQSYFSMLLIEKYERLCITSCLSLITATKKPAGAGLLSV
ncbi:hypothetical protein [Pseudoalteromonas ostreae]|uniref:hypothetical protein n=1 Tax=Pseudoalteromonas ostreae TaxID=2774154 RepID=UPI001B38210E|nr:hypothetical protein [Pseudoalteromonas ostreae]